MTHVMPPTECAVARIRIRAATVVYRSDPLVALLQGSLGLSDAQVDALFPGVPA